MKHIIYIALLIIISSCSNRQESESIYVHLEINPEDCETINFKDFFQETSIIPLETNDTTLISFIYDIKKDGDYLFVLDVRNGSVFVYNDSGKIQHVIQHKGNGPEEYTRISSMAVDPFHKELHLIDNDTKKDLICDYTGNILRIDPLPYPVTQIAFTDKDNRIIARKVTDINGGFVMNCYKNNDLIAQYHPFRYENGATVDYWETPFCTQPNGIYVHIMYNDTIFRYDFNKPDGGVILQMENGIPEELKTLPQQIALDRIDEYIKKHNNKVVHSPYLFKSDQSTIGLAYAYNKDTQYLMYDKLNHTSHTYKGLTIGEVPIKKFLYASLYRDDYMYFILDQMKYDELSDEDKNEIQNNYPELYTIMEKTALEDNPILLVAQFKD